MPRARVLGPVAIAVAFLAGCGRSPLPAASLNPASVPVVEIGFEGQTDTLPYPGGILPSLLRATVSDPTGQNARSWSASPSMVESLKADAVGYAPPTPRTRFSFSVGNRMLNIPLSHATAASPGVDLVAAPWGGTLIVDKAHAGGQVWVEISVVSDDSLDGLPVRIDATYGFWVHPVPP
jgi:hypothetical protein